MFYLTMQRPCSHEICSSPLIRANSHTSFGGRIKDVRANCFCASLLRTQISCRNGATSFIERAHRGRFVGKYSTFGQNDNFAWILRFKEVADPHFFFGHIVFFDKFLLIVKKWTKNQCWKSIFFFPFSTPARSNSAHFEALRVWKCNYLRLVLP